MIQPHTRLLRPDNAADVKTKIVASRAGVHDGEQATIHYGSFICVTCGGVGSVNSEAIARLAGTSSSTVRKWLRREPVRQDIADRIRSVVLRVEE